MRELWGHQREAVSRALGKDHFALFFEPGCGKTRTMIEILRGKYSEYAKLLPTLIFCPPIVIKNWENEILKFSKIKPERIVPLTGSGKERLARFKESDPHSIFITNFETLLMEVYEEFLALGRECKKRSMPTCLILDESHKCKNPTSKRTKLAIELSDVFDFKYILTGTPILNNLMDIYAQYRILDQGMTFGSNFFSFRARYFEDRNRNMPKHNYFPNWKPIPGAEKEIRSRIQETSMFAEKSKCLDLPPLVRKTIEIPLGKEQRRLYESMKEDLIATITGEDGVERASIAQLAIVKALRLQQIASGFIKFEGVDGEEGKVLKLKENPRKEALKALLEDLAPYHKVIVWAVFHDNYDDIRDVCNELELECAELHGKASNRDENVRKFNEDPLCRVLIGHPGSGGIGVTLTASSYSIFYSRSFSLEYDIQAEARNYRAGSEIHEKVTRIDLVASNTIDQIVLESLANKIKISDSVLKEHLHAL